MNIRELITALCVALVLGVLLSPFASSSPDGLEKVAIDKDFIHRAEQTPPVVKSPVPDYVFPGVDDEKAATAAAGFAGTLFTFAAAFYMGKLLEKKV